MKLLYGVLLIGLMGCKTTTTSKEMHDEGRYRNDDSTFQWQDISEQDLVNVGLVPRIGAVKGRPVSDPLRQRLQFWVDQLDQYMRDQDPVKMQKVPKPKIFLFDNPMPNAFVPSMEVCLGRSSQLQSAEGESADFLGIDREFAAIFSLQGPRLCVKTPYQGADLQKFVSWYMQPMPPCNTEVSSRSVSFASNCLDATVEGPKSPSSTKEIFVRVTPNWIIVTTGLIKNLTEYEAVYTIYHEAAHYYMAHLSNPGALYNYFYGLGSANPAGKPKPDPALEETGKELLYWLKAKETGTRKIAAAPGQKYHSGLYVVARNVINEWIKREGTRTSCKDLARYFSEATALGRFPLDALDARGQQVYRGYEQKLDACISGLPLDADLQVQMVGFTRFVAPWSSKILVNVPVFTSVRQLWDYLNTNLPAVIDAPKAKVVENSKRADSLGLGHYTNEQEADELAVEWMVKFGIDPHNGITGALKLLKLEDQFPTLTTSIGAYSYAECQQAFAAGFRNADGSELRVPVGDYSDAHHSSCYRAFNMNREISAHDYQQKMGPLRVTPPAPSWDVVIR